MEWQIKQVALYNNAMQYKSATQQKFNSYSSARFTKIFILSRCLLMLFF